MTREPRKTRSAWSRFSLTPKWSLSIRTLFPPVSYQVLLPLTQVNHERNKTPSDGKLSSLEKLLQPLLGLFAQLHHCNSATDTRETTAANSVTNLHKRRRARATPAFTAGVVSVAKRRSQFILLNLPRPSAAPPVEAHALLILFVVAAAANSLR